MFTSFILSGLLSCAAGIQDPVSVAKMPTASAQLQHAKKVKAEARGTKGAARVAALDKAITAYEAVRDYWPESGSVLAEAAFRRGEIQRTLGRSGLAKGAFQEAFDAGKNTPFAPRALLEIGHLHRRTAEFDHALQHYQRVRDMEGVHLRYVNDSREWMGRVYLDLGEWDKGIRAFAEWAANAETSVDVVRAVDQEALCWLGKKDLETAEARLTKIRVEMEVLANEPTKDGEALRRALERMKAPKQIAEQKKTNSSGD